VFTAYNIPYHYWNFVFSSSEHADLPPRSLALSNGRLRERFAVDELTLCVSPDEAARGLALSNGRLRVRFAVDELTLCASPDEAAHSHYLFFLSLGLPFLTCQSSGYRVRNLVLFHGLCFIINTYHDVSFSCHVL
jgi:hypothetical protein